MGVEGRSRDSSAVFTAITHMWNLINEKGNAAILISTLLLQLSIISSWPLVGSPALCWLQQCLFGCCCHALHSGPFQPNWSPVTLTATKGRKACGTQILSPPR